MMNMTKGLACACALLGTNATAAQATECWNPTQAAAARVRNLQSRLMDATLRCQMVGLDISASYNGFVRENREALRGANAVLRARLGERDYDGFVTSMANLADRAPLDAASCAAIKTAAQSAQVAAGDVEVLLALESEVAVAAELPGGACRITFAAAEATATGVAAFSVTALP